MKKKLTVLIVGLVITLFATGSIAADLQGVNIHGFITQGYLSSEKTNFTSDNENDAFAFSETGINFGKEVTERLRLGIQLFTRNFGEMNNNSINVDWAFADFRFSELLGLRFGQIKFLHGLYNEVRDVDMLRNPIFLPESVYQEVSHDLYVNDIFLSLQGISSRDIFLSLQGVGLYGYMDLSALGGLTYQAMFGTQSIDPNNNISDRQLHYFTSLVKDFSFPDGALENRSIDVDYKYAGNLIWDTPFDGLRFGASLNNIRMTVTTAFTQDVSFDIDGNQVPLASKGELATIKYKKLQNTVFSTEYTWEDLIVMAEYILITKDYKMNAFEAVPFLGNDEHTNSSSGWYVGGAYRLLDWFELGGYYSQSKYEEVKTALEFPVYFFSEFDDICGTMRFDINEYWAIKLEAHKFRGRYPIVDSVTDDILDHIEENWYMYAAKMTVAF